MEMKNVEALKKGVISFMKTETAKHPLFFNMMNGLFLIGMEKILEAEFACPCRPDWNVYFAVVFFLAPTLLLFVVMLNITGCKNQCSRKVAKSVLNSLVLPMVWIILLFMDGRYYVCSRTYWSGRLVKNDELIPDKWCDPNNKTMEAELKEKTQWWVSLSQFCGMTLILILSVVYIMYRWFICLFTCLCCPDEDEDPEPQQQRQHGDFELRNM